MLFRFLWLAYDCGMFFHPPLKFIVLTSLPISHWGSLLSISILNSGSGEDENQVTRFIVKALAESLKLYSWL